MTAIKSPRTAHIHWTGKIHLQDQLSTSVVPLWNLALTAVPAACLVCVQAEWWAGLCAYQLPNADYGPGSKTCWPRPQCQEGLTGLQLRLQLLTEDAPGELSWKSCSILGAEGETTMWWDGAGAAGRDLGLAA